MLKETKNALANHEIVTLAVYLLGGDTQRIDVEDVAVKANDLAPQRFTWRKYPNQINLEAVRKRLWDARKSKKGGYLAGAHELRVADGAPIGRLVVKDSQAWGLGPLFSRRGGDPGDSLRILFDLKTKIAVAELGQASVEEEDEVNQQLAK